MTLEEPATNSGQSWWRRPWVWIVGGATIIVVVGVALIGVLMTVAQQQSATAKPHALLVHMVGQVDDTAVAAGGTWTFQDGSRWSRSDTSGYTGRPCGDTDFAPQQYTVDIVSTGVADPVAAAAKVVKHWQNLGYAVRYVGTTDPTDNDLTEVAADFPDGGGLGYGVATVNSAISASSECSTDPGLSIKTK